MATNSWLLACKDEIGQALYYAKATLGVGPYFQVFNSTLVDSITYLNLTSYIPIIILIIANQLIKQELQTSNYIKA
jgi:hypothetical protein